MRAVSFLCLLFFSHCIFFFLDLPSTKAEHLYKIQVEQDGEEESYSQDREEGEMDLLVLLEIASLTDRPALRFLSTKDQVEILNVNGTANTWKAHWVVWVNGERISPETLKSGVKVTPRDSVRLRYAKRN